MFSTQMFEGEHIRLAALEPELDAPVIAGWNADPEFVHQVTRGPGRPLSTPQIRAQLTREDTESREKRRRFDFAIRTREGDRLIGLVGLREILWNHGEGRLSLAIGSAADRGHGLGAETLGLILRYAFTELNLYRVWLDIGGDNGDAIRFFERHGFVAEVRRRQALERAGQRFDILRLSLLLEEWRGEAVPAATDPAEATSGRRRRRWRPHPAARAPGRLRHRGGRRGRTTLVERLGIRTLSGLRDLAAALASARRGRGPRHAGRRTHQLPVSSAVDRR